MADDQALVKKEGAKAEAAEGEGEGGRREGWLSWVVGWVLVPGTVIGVIFGGGVALGAHRPEGWFARSVMWIAGLF